MNVSSMCGCVGLRFHRFARDVMHFFVLRSIEEGSPELFACASELLFRVSVPLAGENSTSSHLRAV